MAMGSTIDCALEYLRTLGLDEHTQSFLCDALDECVDLNGAERLEFLEVYLEGEDLDIMLRLLPAVSCMAVEANIRRQCGETSGEVAEENALLKAVKEKQEVQRIMEEREIQSGTAQALTEQQAALSSVLELKKEGVIVKETSFVGCVAVSGIDAQDDCFKEAGSIKKGEYVMIRDQICRVMQIDKTSKIWKGPHRGCFQSHVIARGIFTGKKEDVFFPVTQKVTMPFVKREECTVMDVGNGGELSLLTAECDTKEDVNLPTGTEADTELAKRIQTGFDAGETVVVIVLSTCECSKVVDCKFMDVEGKLSCSRQR